MQLRPYITLFTGQTGAGKTYQMKQIAKEKSAEIPVIVYGRAAEWKNMENIQVHSLPEAEYATGYADWKFEFSKMNVPGLKVLIVDGVSCATMIQICALADESFDIYFSLQNIGDVDFKKFLENGIDKLFVGEIAGSDQKILTSIVKDEKLISEICAYTVNGKFSEITSEYVRLGKSSISRKRKPLPNFIKGKHVITLVQAVVAICMTIMVAGYTNIIISYIRSGTLPSTGTIVCEIAVLIIYFGYIISSGKNISMLLQKSDPYEIIYHKRDDIVAVEECEFFYYGHQIQCVWEKERQNKESGNTDKITLLDIRGENITKKNRKTAMMYISEWVWHMQNKGTPTT